MSGFKGQAEYSIDGKGRVPVPAKMRRALRPEANESFTITRGRLQCIHLYPADRWEQIEQGFEQLNRWQEESMTFIRMISMWADDVTLDSQGRIPIPKNLAAYAGLEFGGKATILGAFDHIEIWHPEVFEAYINQQAPKYETLAETVMSGIAR